MASIAELYSILLVGLVTTSPATLHCDIRFAVGVWVCALVHMCVYVCVCACVCVTSATASTYVCALYSTLATLSVGVRLSARTCAAPDG